MNPPPQKSTITTWAEEDRPREKLLLHGRTFLSDSEIIAILIGSGSPDKTAVELSREILGHYNNNLGTLAKAGVKELMQFKGIGEAKAISIVAALELGRRRKNTEPQVKKALNAASDIYEHLTPYMLDLPHEEFWAILLDNSNKPIKTFKVGVGGVSAVVADPKLVLKPAIEYLASALVIAHNHPSGKKKPSDGDISLTRKISRAVSFIDVRLIDHLIFTDDGYFSFANHNLL
ncbi:RadC family protein [Jiulongibacter sediminis]|uniref:MPN domain-containing protein n=1 Tax=Jiulongibacter sediminis TaxID=1605367 RepID=A0A0P7BIM9_9BACT|nr:DNA repair protein RadC [Jiulongibacter sediminis]KPM46981.1 hypothetical protein AFM12_17285 [Jiulongibacter sediminis]TBX22325.1 hypothetical protein TK44_17290 [Jiulongibacter sediminis]